MKRVAGTHETAVVVEVIVEPVEVQVPALAVPVQVGHVPVAVAVTPLCTEYYPRHHPLNILRIVSNSGSKIPPYTAPSIFIFEEHRNRTLRTAVAVHTLPTTLAEFNRS